MDVTLFPSEVTVIDPVVAPAGTVVTIWEYELKNTTAAIPLNDTVLFVAVGSKLVPVMVTVVPSGPLDGVKLVIEGVTMKLVKDTALTLSDVTVIGPVVAPAGTEVTIWEDVLLITTAATPLNDTVFFVAVGSKLPVIITVVPTEPLDGVKLVILVGDAHPAMIKKRQPNVLIFLK